MPGRGLDAWHSSNRTEAHCACFRGEASKQINKRICDLCVLVNVRKKIEEACSKSRTGCCSDQAGKASLRS